MAFLEAFVPPYLYTGYTGEKNRRETIREKNGSYTMKSAIEVGMQP